MNTDGHGLPHGAALRGFHMQWGFKSAWSRQPLINAKAETIATTAFKQHLHHRCLIPADGFYEF
jgi:putative SOS response-associated peptidase YedK